MRPEPDEQVYEFTELYAMYTHDDDACTAPAVMQPEDNPAKVRYTAAYYRQGAEHRLRKQQEKAQAAKDRAHVEQLRVQEKKRLRMERERARQERAQAEATLKASVVKIPRKLSAEHRANISAGLLKRTGPHGNLGKPKSAAHRANMSAARTGKSLSAETRANISTGNKGKRSGQKWPQEIRDRLRAIALARMATPEGKTQWKACAAARQALRRS